MLPSAPSQHFPEVVLLPQTVREAPRQVSSAPSVAPRVVRPVKPFLDEALLEGHHLAGSSKAADLFIAFLVHLVLIAGPILAGLYFTDTINLKGFTATFLVGPPPPLPPAAPAAAAVKSQSTKRIFVSQGKLLAPTYIPKQVADIKEAPIVSQAFEGGVPGGVPGGQLGGVMGGVIGSVLNTNAKPVAPPAMKSSGPVRAGGRVRRPRAISQPQPFYPALARQTKIQGDVVIDAILDEQGNVVEMKLISGHPLLCQAAMDALKHWKYEPTYLNDQPVAVQLVVTVTFHLN
jgi:periplasmic protein TonB